MVFYWIFSRLQMLLELITYCVYMWIDLPNKRCLDLIGGSNQFLSSATIDYWLQHRRIPICVVSTTTSCMVCCCCSRSYKLHDMPLYVPINASIVVNRACMGSSLASEDDLQVYTLAWMVGSFVIFHDYETTFGLSCPMNFFGFTNSYSNV